MGTCAGGATLSRACPGTVPETDAVPRPGMRQARREHAHLVYILDCGTALPQPAYDPSLVIAEPWPTANEARPTADTTLARVCLMRALFVSLRGSHATPVEATTSIHLHIMASSHERRLEPRALR